jgi:hypothetical protein
MDDSANEENSQLTNGRNLLSRNLLDGNVNNHINETNYETGNRSFVCLIFEASKLYFEVNFSQDILVDKELNAQIQLMPHISLIVILTFNCFLVCYLLFLDLPNAYKFVINFKQLLIILVFICSTVVSV